ncbi:hypothetical protein D3C85_724460 [compost metagenome]
MASEPSSRSFLSGDLIWGVKQSDPMGTVQYRNRHLVVQTRAVFVKQRSRYLSENPSTYLR